MQARLTAPWRADSEASALLSSSSCMWCLRYSVILLGSLLCMSAWLARGIACKAGPTLYAAGRGQVAMSSTATQLEATKGDGIGGDGITLCPKGGQYKNVVVWLHGLGDTANGWYPAMPSLNVANTKFILPTAGVRPITLNGGFPMPAWSDIVGLGEDSPEDSKGFEESARRVQAILDAEKAKGIPPGNTAVGGFSQGGAVALHVCLRSAEKLAGCVACSSWVPLRADYPAALGAGAAGTPVAQAHGDDDQVVQYQWGEHSHQLLKGSLGLQADFKRIPGMGHSACDEELEWAVQYCASTVLKKHSDFSQSNKEPRTRVPATIHGRSSETDSGGRKYFVRASGRH